MRLQKKVNINSKFAQSLDKDKDVNSGDILMIASDVRTVETKQYGAKQVVDVRLPNEEVRSLFLNQTSINNLVEQYGEETNSWVGKPVKCLIGITGTGKTMLVLKGK
jgi:hypothetical protein